MVASGEISKHFTLIKNTRYMVSETVGTIRYNTQPVTVEEAV